MKRITRYEQKPVEVVVCDNCGKEVGKYAWGAYAAIRWHESCPRGDGCSDDSGDMAFCSHPCFNAGIHQILEDVKPDEKFWQHSLTIEVRSRGEGDNLHDFLTALTNVPTLT